MWDFIQSLDPVYWFSGVLVGEDGVGGGSMMTPLLILVFGVHPATAVGTDLSTRRYEYGGSALVHGDNKTVDRRVVGRLATGSIPATLLTVGVLYW